MDTLFDITFLLQETKKIHHVLLPFLPRHGEQIELNGIVYIVIKTMYDLSAYQCGCTSAIPAKISVRRKTDNDF